ncbi:MAG: hypothetical protein EZS26_001488 [Candidatus Ordinivivax streblomastigis]|uniref:YhcG N-terminal domain-containing protein n=1 Tax=Candidatus Ordinivivax streblomastigis TaxID=2540710 RepID=A0A5M8P1Q8_9BACT|nr:MAG: hypothetical protein EZS26_001488 [Candidatus Ordinivivax streblomastigis]
MAIPEQLLFNELSQLIERSKAFVATQANSTLTLLFWKIGKRINETILQNRRAEYGKQIVVTLSRQLTWSHFLTLIPLKNDEARLFYAREVLNRQFNTFKDPYILDFLNLKDEIMVEELPPKKELEHKIHALLIEARERIERNKSLPK